MIRLALALALLVVPAQGQTLAQLHRTGVLHCAAEPRAGFAEVDDDGTARGLAVDLCKAVAIATIGPGARIDFAAPEGGNSFEPLRHGKVQLAFLSGGTIAEQNLTAALIPGPAVFADPVGVMVPQDSPIHTLQDLAGQTVCLMIGSAPQRALEAFVASTRINLVRSTWREPDELMDTYNSRNCDAVVETATRLAQIRGTQAVNHITSRLLNPPLALTPILATTPSTDSAWASLALWTLNALIGGEGTPWQAPATVPGLRATWRSDVHTTLGTYAEMRTRALGPGTWPNAPWPDGVLLPGVPQ